MVHFFRDEVAASGSRGFLIFRGNAVACYAVAGASASVFFFSERFRRAFLYAYNGGGDFNFVRVAVVASSFLVFTVFGLSRVAVWVFYTGHDKVLGIWQWRLFLILRRCVRGRSLFLRRI